ncbi:flagellum-associated coiled-coil domain-containing protein 1-like isoform X2 [Watersipora subatra]|uniref:flagellum-associated coiled-coil domain-containing protein 1-like isoform X2 n=1 Tax=Watersipora subatra TaxID=2589382 RepID=UPI00355B0C46
MKTGSTDSPSSLNSFSTSSVAARKDDRPKSTPSNRFRVAYTSNTSQQRPKTASLIYQNCSRLGEVERESVRQHKFKSHLPARHEKPSPWQAQLEGTQKPVHVAPGYILSRSKSKYQMLIRDKLFELQDARAKENHGQDVLKPEIEQLVNSLKEQVADLSLHLEEERMNHRDTKRKAEEFMQDKVDEMRRDQKEALRRLSDEHKQFTESAVADHQQELQTQQDSYEAIIAKHRTEMAFLQGAFESYKSQRDAEHREALTKLQEESERNQSEVLQSHLQELGKKLTNDKTAALAAQAREHNKAIMSLEKQSSRELEALNRRFANHAADIRKLKEAENEKEELTEKCDHMCQRIGGLEKELANVKRDRAEYKAKLAVFESEFAEKVEDVDRRYRAQIAELMEQNTQLRKQYMSKCEQLYAVTAQTERDKTDQLLSSKEAMKVLIQSRSNAYVSIAAKDPKIQRSIPKERPCSAPSTTKEVYMASVSAGETDEVLARKEVPFVRPQSVLELSAVFDTKELNLLTDEELAEGLVAPPDY